MSQHRHELEFFDELHQDLVSLPGEATVRRHITRAARTAVASHQERRGQVIRLGLASLALTTVISTSGIAVAGSLPAPVQGIVADAARLLPVPIPIPYPTTPALEQVSEPAVPPLTIPPDPQTDEAAAETTSSANEPGAEAEQATPPEESNEVAGTDRDRDRDSDRDWDDDRDRDERDQDGDGDDLDWDEDSDDERDRDGHDRDRDDDRDNRDRDHDRDDGDWDRDDDGGDDDSDDEDHRDFRNQDDRSERDDR